MDWTIWMFLTVAIVVFGIVMIAAGAFSAYFRKGMNRGYGVIIAVVGLIVLLFWLWLTIWSAIPPFNEVNVWGVILDAVIYLMAVIIGALVAIGIFLVTVLKS